MGVRRRSVRLGWVRVRSDSGFSMVEVMIASGLVFGAIVALMQGLSLGVRTAGSGREREAANALVDQTIEQVRALPFDDLDNGYNQGDLVGDPNIDSACGSQWCYNGESLLVDSDPNYIPKQPSPLYPHRQTASACASTTCASNTSVGVTPFTISTYVTNLNNDAAMKTYRITAIVTWKPLGPADRGQSQAQTILHYPAGCLSLQTRPFSGRCVTAFSGQATVPSGSIHIAAHVANGQPVSTPQGGIDGISLDHADVRFPKATADLQSEQITVTDGGVQTSAASLEASGGTQTDAGLLTAAAAANDDPEEPGTLYTTSCVGVGQTGCQGTPPVQVPASASLACSTCSAGNSRTLTLEEVQPPPNGGGDSGEGVATPSAVSGTRTCPTTGTAKSDSLPCGFGTVHQAATTDAKLTLGSFGSATIASAAPMATGVSSTATVERLTSPGTGKCAMIPTSPANDGCARMSATRGAQNLSVGGFPSGVIAPANWSSSFVQLVGYSDTAAAEVGIGTGTPTASVAAGSQIKYYCASTNTDCPSNKLSQYVSVYVTAMTPGHDITVPTVTAFDAANQMLITMSAVIHPGSTHTDQTQMANCTPAPCPKTTAADASVNPPTVTVEYQAVYLGTTVTDIDLTLDPGTLLVGGSYAKAAS